MTYNELKTRLEKYMMEVTFTKVNGEQRIMTCTLHPDALPPAIKEDAMSQKKVRELNENVLNVWDTNAKGWRSFRVANVTETKIKTGACRCGRTQNAPFCDGSHSKALEV
mgnify:CR=1 FL=1